MIQNADSMFDVLVDEYESTSGTISRKISQQALLSGAAKASMNDEIEILIEDADNTVRSMKIEHRSLPRQQKEQYSGHLKRYTNDLNQLRTDFSRSKNTTTREALFDRGSDVQESDMSQHASLLQSTRTAEMNTNRLHDAHRNLVDIESQGTDIMLDLRQQRETINRARTNVRSMDSILGHAKRVLGRMSRREAVMSLVWCFVVVMMVSVIAILIYFKVR
eukprot:64039_1